MGRRVGMLRWLTDEAALPDIVVTTAPALIQRVPPPEVVEPAHIEFRVGDGLDQDSIGDALEAIGYVADDRVDEPGEYALRGKVVDLYPAAATGPCRIEHEAGRIAAIRSYDAQTQRSVVETELLWVDPASEVISRGGEAAGGDLNPHLMPRHYGALSTLLDYVPSCRLVLEPGAERRALLFIEQLNDAHDTARALARGRELPPPDALYMTQAEWSELLENGRPVLRLVPESEGQSLPKRLRARDIARVLAPVLASEEADAIRIVVAARTAKGLNEAAAAAERATGRRACPVKDWWAVLASKPGSLSTLVADLDGSFLSAHTRTLVLVADGTGRTRPPASGSAQGGAVRALFDVEFAIGDAVVHIDHGMGVLEGLDPVTLMGDAGEAVRIRYAKGAALMVPTSEFGKVWRYGSEEDAVKLDALKGGGWTRKRERIEAALAEVAARLVALAQERAERRCPAIVPPASEFTRFCDRFPHALTLEQSAAVDAVMADLSSGRPMNRLICADVGYGKTEIALRAAAATVLSGRQAVLVVPTTVLARQHGLLFERRFAPFGVKVAHLSRLVTAREARAVREDLISGEARLAIATHAILSEEIAFSDLGLVIIDEEQRFGARAKEKLRALREGVHVLATTATPIPRTLQSALAGLQDVSFITTPPTRRQPIRTAVVTLDRALVRAALVRERARQGQSFLVCPRVADIAPVVEELGKLVPELEIVSAHGEMSPDELDEAMVSFAEGSGDVLVATNIIENGLDVPNANTMLIWHPDRFGLAQLHQLRGRVGRGARRALVYLLPDNVEALSPAARKRLATLERLDRLGAGFAISARDLDLRGAGELLGEEQAGHVNLLGLGLYQHLMANAIARTRGKPVEDWSPEVKIGPVGRIPEVYVPEEEIRINLHARLHRLGDVAGLDSLEEEIADRFGPVPAEMASLLATARIRVLSRALGIAKLEAGPQALALSLRPESGLCATLLHPAGDRRFEASGERFVAKKETSTLEERIEFVVETLESLGSPAG
jgi:transcription-repair coupling factor (superfamily II helicase)